MTPVQPSPGLGTLPRYGTRACALKARPGEVQQPVVQNGVRALEGSPMEGDAPRLPGQGSSP